MQVTNYFGVGFLIIMALFVALVPFMLNRNWLMWFRYCRKGGHSYKCMGPKRSAGDAGSALSGYISGNRWGCSICNHEWE